VVEDTGRKLEDEEAPLTNWLAVSIFVAQPLDIALTISTIKTVEALAFRVHAVEQNPLIRPLLELDATAFAWTKISVALLLLVLVHRTPESRKAWSKGHRLAALIGMSLLTWTVIVWNTAWGIAFMAFAQAWP